MAVAAALQPLEMKRLIQFAAASTKPVRNLLLLFKPQQPFCCSYATSSSSSAAPPGRNRGFASTVDGEAVAAIRIRKV